MDIHEPEVDRLLRGYVLDWDRWLSMQYNAIVVEFVEVNWRELMRN